MTMKIYTEFVEALSNIQKRFYSFFITIILL
jgi:hypothetical protein